MDRADLVVAVGAYYEEVRALGRGEDQLEQAQRGRVGPLQIVEEERERMRRRREHLEERLERELEAMLRLGRAELGHRSRRADHQLELGNKIHDHARVRSQRGAQLLGPDRERGLRLRQDRPDQLTARLRDRRVRNGAAELIELAGDEAAST